MTFVSVDAQIVLGKTPYGRTVPQNPRDGTVKERSDLASAHPGSPVALRRGSSVSSSDAPIDGHIHCQPRHGITHE